MRPERASASRRNSALRAKLRRVLARSRHRRLVFVLALAPGLTAAMVIGPALRSPIVMLLGLGLAGAAVLGRALSEPWFAAPVTEDSVWRDQPGDPNSVESV